MTAERYGMEREDARSNSSALALRELPGADYEQGLSTSREAEKLFLKGVATALVAEALDVQPELDRRHEEMLQQILWDGDAA